MSCTDNQKIKLLLMMKLRIGVSTIFLLFFASLHPVALMQKNFKVFVGPKSILWGNWTGAHCFGLWMVLPMGYKARVDSTSPAMIPTVISDCWNTQITHL